MDNELAYKASSIVNGTFVTDRYSVLKYSGAGAMAGLVVGFCYAMFSGKSKIGWSLIGTTCGSALGLAFDHIRKIYIVNNTNNNLKNE